MLPDYPKTKSKLERLQKERFVKVRNSCLGPFIGERVSRPFEGDRSVVIWEDGTIHETKFHSIKTEMQIDLREIDKHTPKEILRQIDTAAQQMGLQQASLNFETIQKAADESGNIVDAKGERFQLEHYLQLLEKIDLDFDENEKPILPTIMVGPDLADRLAKVIAEAESSPEFDKVIAKKREQWRDRESARKLVG